VKILRGYLIGVDGGGTKTDFMLCRRDYEIVRQLTLEGCNPNDIGMTRCTKILKSGLNQIIKDIDLTEISIFAGLSGGITGNNRGQILKFLHESFPGAAVDCGSDAENAVEIGLKDHDGIAVICGTGSILFVKKGEELHRMGGYGYLFGDGCSGYAFGSAAISAALRANDGSGEATLILELVNQRVGMSVLAALGEIYRKGKSYIASFADIVFDAHKSGDPVAGKIIMENVQYILKLIQAAREKYQTGDRVVLLGGVFKHQPFLLEQFKGLNCSIFDELPVMGAVRLAGKRSNL